MMSSGAIVPRTTSIRVRELPCISASPSTTSMTTTPRLSGTALEMDKDDAAVLSDALDQLNEVADNLGK